MKCCDLNSGMLRTEISIERESRSSDGAGGFTKTWGAVSGAPTLAYVRDTSGFERFVSERTEAISTAKVTIRFFTGVKESDTIVIDSRRCNIRSINDLERKHKWLEITVDEGVAV